MANETKQIIFRGNYRGGECIKTAVISGGLIQLSKRQLSDAKRQCCYAGTDYLRAYDPETGREMDIDDRDAV